MDCEDEPLTHDNLYTNKRAEHLKTIQTGKTKREQLEKLCRALQDERRVLKEQVQNLAPENDAVKSPQDTEVTETVCDKEEDSEKPIPSNS